MLDQTPPVQPVEKPKQVTPFAKPEGNFELPRRFKTEYEARAYQKLKGGKVDADHVLGGWVVIYARKDGV